MNNSECEFDFDGISQDECLKDNKQDELRNNYLYRDYLKDISNYECFTEEEEKEYTTEYYKTRNKEIRNKIVNANLRLVVSIAKRYTKYDINMLDIIQDGNLGLMRAVEMFDPNKECRFSTYASRWIMQYIVRGIDNKKKMIRIPVYQLNFMKKVLKRRNNLLQIDGKYPSVEDLAAYYEVSEDEIKEALRYARAHTSLNQHLNYDFTDFDCELQDIMSEDNLINNKEDHFFDDYDLFFLKDIIEEVVSNLPERQQDIIRMRFGLNPYTKELSLKEIGVKYHVTGEAIRQAEIGAMKKLRRFAVLKQLTDFMPCADIKRILKENNVVSID